MYRKRNNIKKNGPRILVLCEGTTEKLYFTNMKKTLSRLTIRDIDIDKAKETAAPKILQEAIRRQLKAKTEMLEYDEAWIVFDDDNQKNLKLVFEKAKRNNIKIAYSSISFEFWYFLHFNKKATVFKDADAAKHELEKYIPDYHESMPGIFQTIKSKYSIDALPNAKWLQKQKGYKDMYTAYTHNPITNVNELTEKILNFEK